MEYKVNNILVNGKIYEICPDWDNIKNKPNLCVLDKNNKIPLFNLPESVNDIWYGRMKEDESGIFTDFIIESTLKGAEKIKDKLYIDCYSNQPKVRAFIWNDIQKKFFEIFADYKIDINNLKADLYGDLKNKNSIRYISNNEAKLVMSWNE